MLHELKWVNKHTYKKGKALTSLVAFHSMKRLRVLEPPRDGMLVYRKVTPQHYVTGTHFYTWVETERECGAKFLSKERTRQQRPGLQTTDPQGERPTP